MMAEGYVWIVTDGLAGMLDSADPAGELQLMQGVVGVKPYVPETERLRDFKRRWRRQFLLSNPETDAAEPCIDVLRAYDTVWALALAVESLTPPVTQKQVLEAILRTEFEGITGRFHLVAGELHAPGYKFVNVVAGKQLEVGHWTPYGGLSRHLDWAKKDYSTSKDDLRRVIWPGEREAVPRGWENPTGEKKMRIGVPNESGFDAIIKVEHRPETNETFLSGYAVDVFEAALKELPYAVPFEYVPFVGSYDSLIDHLRLQKFDAVVGDITITSSRAEFADFTLPFTPRGVSMVVPFQEQGGTSGWIFLKPLELNLWLAAAAFFVFTGVVVWLLEHRVNSEFRGPPASQIGALFYFSFSTLVFAHKEKIVSNLSRVVVIVWLFVVLILTSSYTASLASMFTVRKLQPEVAAVGELIRNGEYVGYPRDSFVLGVLKGWGFRDFQLKPYLSPQEYEAALARGSRNGGVSAIVDELPYLQVFLKQYCSHYMMSTDLTYNTEGLGFAFPRGSSLAGDLSRALENLSDDGRMEEIQRKWFGDEDACPERDQPVSTRALEFRSFWGLFFITGAASTSALLIFTASSFRRSRVVLQWETSGMSARQKLLSFFKYLDQREWRYPVESCSPRSTSYGVSMRELDSPMSMSNHKESGHREE